MRRFTRAEKKAYQVSNSRPAVDFAVTPSMRRKVSDLALWLAEGNQGRVKETTQFVLDLLCDAARIGRAELTLEDAAKARFRGARAVWKLYGTYEPRGSLPDEAHAQGREGGHISIAFRTAVKRKVFAYKTFLNTVVHEFMHHYDTHKLGLAATFHTSGFFHRVRDLMTRLLTAEAATA